MRTTAIWAGLLTLCFAWPSPSRALDFPRLRRGNIVALRGYDGIHFGMRVDEAQRSLTRRGIHFQLEEMTAIESGPITPDGSEGPGHCVHTSHITYTHRGFRVHAEFQGLVLRFINVNAPSTYPQAEIEGFMRTLTRRYGPPDFSQALQSNMHVPIAYWEGDRGRFTVHTDPAGGGEYRVWLSFHRDPNRP